MDQRELHGRMVRVNYANDIPRGGGFRGGGGYGGGGDGGYGRNNYGGDAAESGGYGGNSYGTADGFSGESQTFADSGNTFGDADGQVEGSYRNNDEPDDFATRA
ncbi:hypothetical protein L1987_29700 [Smallanthus sonchifolius]|uniref:Uncharacterized protein n=1 Tax=Smallanthus sonchifolius TaxID=185202 RepID=A0ACB9I1G2_9ASTR|nr:hypothetical protein L1987_29700 [Smallanthus sonchifolius]